MNQNLANLLKEILIVEDDDDIRTDLAEFLAEAGYPVAVARNGKEALDHLHRSGRTGIILLDLMMPVMNGWEFRFEQQQDEELAKIPVILLSGVSDVLQTAASLKVDGFVRKPFALDALFRTLCRYS